MSGDYSLGKREPNGGEELPLHGWPNAWGRDARTIIVFVSLFLLLIPVFFANAAGTADSEFFETWQKRGESFVLATIESDRVGTPVDAYGLTTPRYDLSSPYSTADVKGPYSTIDLAEVGDKGAQSYSAYEAQLGLMGHLYSVVYQYTPCSSLRCLHLVSSTLFSLVLVVLVYLLGILTRRSFAVIFLLSIVASPWIVTGARNLYWSPWTWLLPVCASALFVLVRGRRWRVISLVFIFVAFAVRFASGYEFITSMSLMAASVPLLHFVAQKDFRPTLSGLRSAFKDALVIFGVSVASFTSVLLIHASIRGDGSLVRGLSSIWSEDIQRRTYGLAENFSSSYAESLNADALSVLKKYIFNWQTNFITLGGGTPFTITFGPLSFWILISICVLIVAVRFARRDTLWLRDALLLTVTATIPVSWYLLGKSHSYIHTHINFILWYLFFAAALFYVIYEYLTTRTPVLRVTSYLTRRN